MCPLNKNMVKHRVKALRPSGECQCHEDLFSSDVVDTKKLRGDEVDIYDTRLYQILRPFLWYMRLNGLFFVHNHPASYKPEAGFRRHYREGDQLWKANSIACFLLHFFSVPFYIMPVLVIGKFDPFTLNHFLFSFWESQCSMATMACFSMSRNPDKFSRLCESWEEIIWCEHERDKVEVSFAKRTKRLLALGLAVNILNTSGWCLMVYGGKPGYFPDSFQEIVNPVVASMAQIDYCISHLIGTCAWSLPYFLYANLVLSLRDTLKLFNSVLDKALLKHDGTHVPHVSNFVLRFQHNIKVIEALSASFGIKLLLKVIMDMLITCLNTYLLLFVCYDTETKMLQVFWTAVDLSVLTYLSHISSQINALATEGYYKINNLSFKNSRGEMYQYANYLFRMTGPAIGMSMAGFSVLTKGTMGALIGTYLSYFFLIGQFQQPLPCDEIANVTTTQNSSDLMQDLIHGGP